LRYRGRAAAEACWLVFGCTGAWQVRRYEHVWFYGWAGRTRCDRRDSATCGKHAPGSSGRGNHELGRPEEGPAGSYAYTKAESLANLYLIPIQ